MFGLAPPLAQKANPGDTAAMTEFELIEQYFTGWPGRDDSLLLGQGDDCLIWQNPRPLAISIDTAVQGRHFPEWASGAQVAQRAFLPAISDLAAMGASPAFFTLALTLPKPLDEDWLASFAGRLRVLAGEHQILLAGGDTTGGPAIVISIQVHGYAEQALTRKAARPGDDVWLSGHTGLAAAAVRVLLQDPAAVLPDAWSEAYWQPSPRLALGQALLPLAHAAIDVSDGLCADVEHIARASGVHVQLDARRIPRHESLSQLAPNDALDLMLNGGDDYELAFTAPASNRNAIAALRTKLALPLHRIGQVRHGDAGVSVVHNGQALSLARPGYQHF